LSFLRALAAHDDFAAGAVDTGWVERELGELLAWPGPPTSNALGAAVAAMSAQWSATVRASRAHDPGSPWLESAIPEAAFLHRGEIALHRSAPTLSGVPPSKCGSGSAISDGARVTAHDGGELVVADADERVWSLTYQAPFAPRRGTHDDEAHPGAPMPGRVVAILCRVGQQVAPGDALLVLEAMKMEYTLQARAHGVVERVHYDVGDMVDAEVPLVDIRTEAA
jgi:3-methylcrotonyl-CoA carboxylase alpha subunit